MSKFRFGVGLAITLLASGSVHAQINSSLNPGNRPAFSPWLNLNRSGASAATNYFGIVRPQFAFSNNIQQLQQQETALAMQMTDPTLSTVLPPTGHRAGFMTHTRYFNTIGGLGGTSGASATGRTGGNVTTNNFQSNITNQLKTKSGRR